MKKPKARVTPRPGATSERSSVPRLIAARARGERPVIFVADEGEKAALHEKWPDLDHDAVRVSARALLAEGVRRDIIQRRLTSLLEEST